MTSSLTYWTDGKFQNYGKILEILCPKFKWKKDKINPTLSNKNSTSKYKSYLDGSDIFTLKRQLFYLVQNREYSITTYMYPEEVEVVGPTAAKLYIKPSHPFIGQGKDIKITNSENIFDDYYSLKHDGVVEWIIQEEVYPPSLIDGKKWDIRHYALILYTPDSFYFFSFDRGLIRISTADYKEDDYSFKANVTNISVHEKEKNYDPNKNLIEAPSFLMEEINKIIVQDVLKLASEYLDQNGEFGYLILGFDTIVKSRETLFNLRGGGGKYELKLIEVNNQPFMDISANNNNIETRINLDFWTTLISSLFPKLEGQQEFNKKEGRFNFLFSELDKTSVKKEYQKPAINDDIKKYQADRYDVY